MRFIQWSGSAASTQQDRLRKCSLAFVAARTALTRTTQHTGQHDDRQRPESSGQKHHAPGLDWKSLTDWLGRTLLRRLVHEKLMDGPTSAKKVEGDDGKEDALHESESYAEPCLKDEPLS